MQVYIYKLDRDAEGTHKPAAAGHNASTTGGLSQEREASFKKNSALVDGLAILHSFIILRPAHSNTTLRYVKGSL